MSHEDELMIRKIFAENLRKMMDENGKTPADINRELKVAYSTISNWVNGQKIPRMGTLERLCQYLHCEKSDLLQAHDETYYRSRETAKLAQTVFENEDLRILLDAQKDLPSEDLKLMYNFALRLKEKERANE